MQYRASLGVIRDILLTVMEAGIEGIIISKICRKANLSHDTAMANCHRLVDIGLLQSTQNKRNHIFVITEKGIKFCQEFLKFQDTTKELNIRY